MGVIWWAGGILGIVLARNNQVNPYLLRDNVVLTQSFISAPLFQVSCGQIFILAALTSHDVPSIIITGWAFSDHSQALMLSTKARFYSAFDESIPIKNVSRSMPCLVTHS